MKQMIVAIAAMLIFAGNSNAGTGISAKQPALGPAVPAKASATPDSAPAKKPAPGTTASAKVIKANDADKKAEKPSASASTAIAGERNITMSNVSAQNTRVVVKKTTRIRKNAKPKSLAYRKLQAGEQLEIIEIQGDWLKVRSIHKFESGAPMVGYVWSADTSYYKSMAEVPLKQKVVQRIVEVNQPAENLKSAEKDKEILSEMLKSLESEKQQFDSKLTGLQKVLSVKDKEIKNYQMETSRLRDEIKHLQGQLKSAHAEAMALRTGGKSRLFAMADNGETVFFKGVGTASMAVGNEKTVLRFSVEDAIRADKALAGAKAEKHVANGYVYYLVEPSILAF